MNNAEGSQSDRNAESSNTQNGMQDDNVSKTSKEIDTCYLDENVDTTSLATPCSRSHLTHSRNNNIVTLTDSRVNSINVPILLINRSSAATYQPQSPITSQPKLLQNFLHPMNRSSQQPQSLFLQALAKLNESSLNLAVLTSSRIQNLDNNNPRLSEPSPPDSLTSAPPSYSFVLRQSDAQRRPRLMGTFIPSPSFVQHTPPPNYATAFDIYVDNPQPLPSRVNHYGFTSVLAVCPQCGYAGLTITTSKVTLCTHLCAVVLCLTCCWICAPMPYFLRSCKNVYHYCRGCRRYLGMYCPTNPENPYTA